MAGNKLSNIIVHVLMEVKVRNHIKNTVIRLILSIINTIKT